MDYIMSLPWDEFAALLLEAAEQRRRADVRQEWLAMLPWMGKDNFVGFDEFYRRRTVQVPRGRPRPAEEILEDARRIREAATQQTA